MKFIYSILFLFIIQNLSCQKLPDDFEKQPDGITINYFDDSNQKERISSKVFIGQKFKFKFPFRNNYKRIDISKKTIEIKIIQENLTEKLIDDILKCCFEKKCPDSTKGYFLMIKKENKIKYATIDYNFINTENCGTTELQKIIDAFQKL